jgi:Phage integrase family
MVRALVGVWLFAGLRIDELRRLEPDCILWDQGRDEGTGQPYPVCLLRVPQNKTSGPFNKPVDPLVGQLIDAWKLIRPPQPQLEDRTTGQRREHLFCYRGQLVGAAYLNERVIPALCRKAGVPETDSRGALTSHRARATIATQLLNATEPLTLADLQQWLGHKHPSSTRHYAAILQRKLTAAYHKADYFARNVRTIQVLVDRETILSGAAAAGEPWKYYDLGEGWCTYDFFAKCPHRLACARCPFYLPKHSSRGQLLAVKDGIDQMLERIDLTDEEPCPCQGTPTAQAISAARPWSEKAACSMPTARPSLRRRTVQLRCAVPSLSARRPAASRANWSRSSCVVVGWLARNAYSRSSPNTSVSSSASSAMTGTSSSRGVSRRSSVGAGC